MSCKTASSLTPFNTNHGGGNVAHLVIVYHQQILDFLTITKKTTKYPPIIIIIIKKYLNISTKSPLFCFCSWVNEIFLDIYV